MTKDIIKVIGSKWMEVASDCKSWHFIGEIIQQYGYKG